jgi:outer membrane lipoprotein SlyB
MKIIVSVLMLTLSACSPKGVNDHRIVTVGNARPSIEAVVISHQSVMIEVGTTGMGPVIGGTTGGLIANNNSDDIGIIIAGIIAGAVVGEVVESDGNLHQATEYVIQTQNGLLLTVVQANQKKPIFLIGESVILIHGYPSRLIKDPRK